MTRLRAHWTPHTVTVTPYLGQGSRGAIYGPPVKHSPETGNGVYVEDSREVVVDASGAEAVSETKVHMAFDDAPATGSRVRVWEGTPHEREAPVIKVSLFNHPRWPGYAVVHLR